MRIACWSGPRNISTAIMRSWSSRKDTYVIDEPFYAYYLNETQYKHPMYKEILNQYSIDYNEIVNLLTGRIPKNKKIFYQKHMAHHIFELNNIDWIKKCKNCILIRHPKEVIASYKDKNQIKSVLDLGYYQQCEIIKLLKKTNESYIIIESSDLLKNPNKALNDWCKKLNIDFDTSMLQWEKGKHPNDGIWWKHWYDNVIGTTGFQEFEEKDITIENQYDSIYNESMRYYKYLQDFKL